LRWRKARVVTAGSVIPFTPRVRHQTSAIRAEMVEATPAPPARIAGTVRPKVWSCAKRAWRCRRAVIVEREKR